MADAALSVVASAEPGSMDLDKKKMLVKILEGKRKVLLDTVMELSHLFVVSRFCDIPGDLKKKNSELCK